MRSAPGAGGGGPAGAARAAPPKRQPGFSIVNPRSRRRVVAGAKLALVSGSVSPTPARAAATTRDDGDANNDDNDDERTEEREL